MRSRADSYPTIQTIADAMNKVKNPVRAEGHTDSIPIHNSRFRSNWELSAARSIALVELLTKFGVAPERLSIAGYGDTDSHRQQRHRGGPPKKPARRYCHPE